MYALPLDVFEPQLLPGDVERIRALVGDRLGVRIKTQELEKFRATILAQMRRFICPTSADYYQLLATKTTQSPHWQPIIIAVTNTESCFFRDRGQFELLRARILPELIRRRSPQKRLNIWSVGCSTGEEVYSLAILLMELIPDFDQWQITILGIDINLDSLCVAQEGQYHPWSCRLLEPAHLQYFEQLENGNLVVHSSLRQSVNFLRINLLEEPIALHHTPVDLILCRNVCIHLKSQAIAKLLKQFHQALHTDGYLMTGHAELYGQNLGRFQTLIFPSSRIYQPKPQTKVKTPLPLLPNLDGCGDRASTLHLSHPIFITPRCSTLNQP